MDRANLQHISGRWFTLAGLVALLGLAACGSPPKPKPQDLGAVPNNLPLQSTWSYAAGPIDMSLAVSVQPNGLALANAGVRCGH